MNQPTWKLLGNLGDENYIDHGGFFVYEDTTGVYGHEAELLVSENEHETEATRWTVYRFSIPQCSLKMREMTAGLDDSILSDNRFHPGHPAWFAQPESKQAQRPQDTTYLSKIADYAGMTLEMLREWFCDAEPMRRAHAYRLVGEYHGFNNFDNYPLHFNNRADVEARYKVQS
jgi:hypothetical protein